MSHLGTILVLDDDPGMCETIGDVLQQRGHAVQIARSARAGLELATTRPVEAAIVDMRLPDMTGIDVLHRLRRTLPTTEVIFITGYASLSTAIQAINGLAFAYLVKPFEMTHLTATVEQALHKRRLAEALRESEEQYRLVTENIADAVFLLDSDSRLVFSNRSAELITGYAEPELRGRSILSLLTPESGDRLRAELARARRGRSPARFVEVQFARKDSRLLLAELHVTGVIKDGLSIGQLGVARDISERRNLEEQLRHAQKIEGIGRLAGGIAHDFNNLLTAIGGRCYLLLRQLPEDSPLRGNVEIIKGATDRAARLTQQLLAFSRKQILELRVLDLNAIVAGIQPLLRRMIGEDIEVTALAEPDLGQIKGDPGQIEQVLMNLAVNARDAMPGGGRLIVETANVVLDETYARTHSGVEPGPYVMLAVSDTGHGMDAAVQARIFEPFFTTKEIGKGTGLGLATVYGIVKQSGGHIAVYSEVGHGSTFKVYLPRVDGPLLAEEAPGPEAPAPRGWETVLVVEDDEALRTLAREVLTLEGYTVIESGQPADALARMERHEGPIHLLLTDVVMPQMSGIQLAELLRAARPGLKVLFMSGYTDGAMVRRGVLQGGTHLLNKPFTPDGLTRKVREILTESAP
jgi:PAS domain S-box-containing protein